MGSNTDFKNFGDGPGSLGLARQSSVYSLTFEEFQNTMGGMGKDFGSMNMDELLKSIWSAEETQILASSGIGVGTGVTTGVLGTGNLQRQGSITLPRTLSQKTVDEVWRDLANKESNNNEASYAATATPVGLDLPQRQQTLGEMTLEEFLVRAGIVREDSAPAPPSQTQQMGITRPNNNNNNNINNSANNTANITNNPGFGLPNSVQSNRLFGNGAVQMSHSSLNQPPILPLSFGGARPSQQQQQNHQQQIFPKSTTGTGNYAPPMHIVSNAQLTSPGNRQGNQTLMGLSAQNTAASSLVQNRGLMGGACGVTVAAVSPVSHLSPDVVVKTGLDSPSSLSPVPYLFNRRGKCGAALEKVIERRQKRMIKNRESAARSRARKQAYTMELEAEVAKLKEMNEELQRKQDEIIEMQKNQILESINQQWGSKRQCLRRTFTGPW